MTIAAILDLDKAIATFKETIQVLLGWGDLSEWDGQQCKQQEEQMRQAGLELALAVHCSVALPIERSLSQLNKKQTDELNHRVDLVDTAKGENG